VQGEVLDVRTAASGSGVELSLGQRYPDPNRFVVVVPETDADSLKLSVGTSICATGTVALTGGLYSMPLASRDALRPAA